MGIIGSIKNQAAKSGGNKEKILYVKADSKVRIRFLQELDDGYEFTFHDSYAEGINAICQEELGKNCPLCGNEDLRTRSLYAWSVYNYDTKKVEVMLYAVNQCTPVQSLVNMSENYNTIMDRDYVLSKSGKGQSTTYTVIPQDKQKFRNTKASPYTKSAILKILDKAYPLSDEFKEDDDEDDDIDFVEEDLDEEDEKKSKSKKSSNKKASKKKKEVEEEIDDEEDDEEDEEEYARIDDDEVEESFNPKKSRKKKTTSSKKKENNISVEDMEEILEDEDIDEDEFLEYLELSSLKKIKKTKKAFKSLIAEYLEYIEDEDD
uniref:hypothetical protein n=1 Tax=Methanobrevibacter smithii TaxID=2173 RepID=UPI0037DDB1E5